MIEDKDFKEALRELGEEITETDLKELDEPIDWDKELSCFEEKQKTEEV
jgi:hypothetical protein